MAKFVTLPQHWNKKPIGVNIDKILVVEHSFTHDNSSRIVIDEGLEREINMPFDELIVLLNSTEKE